MGNLKNKIETIMNETADDRFTLLPKMLFTLSIGYGGAVRIRNHLYHSGLLKTNKLPCKTISVGNLCVGGTGKTPMTIYIAQLIKNSGYKVCILSRGYKGRSQKKGGIVTDGDTLFMTPDEAGDEPYMMAQKLKGIPILVGKDRFQSGIIAVNHFNAEVIVLDDAFQHRALTRDVDLVLLDAKDPFVNGKLLPRGRLREPINVLSRSHAIVLTRRENQTKEHSKTVLRVQEVLREQPIFYSNHIPYISKILSTKGNAEPSSDLSLDCLKNKQIVAFSGIAENENFVNTIKAFYPKPPRFFGFPDHHTYSDNDLQGIFRAAKQTNADYIITTEKDFYKLPSNISWPRTLVVIGIHLSMGQDTNRFEQFLINRISEY